MDLGIFKHELAMSSNTDGGMDVSDFRVLDTNHMEHKIVGMFSEQGSVYLLVE